MINNFFGDFESIESKPFLVLATWPYGDATENERSQAFEREE